MVKKVPKGTSDYQASWIVDEQSESDEELSDEVRCLGYFSHR